MATKNLFESMLNQKPAQPLPQIEGKAIKGKKPPGPGQLAYITSGNSIYRHPMEGRGGDVSASVWPKTLSYKAKKEKF